MRAGWYELGHFDGAVDTVLVRLDEAEAGDLVPVDGTERARRMAFYALTAPGYWWRALKLPSILPISLHPTYTSEWYWNIPLPPPPRYEP